MSSDLHALLDSALSLKRASLAGAPRPVLRGKNVGLLLSLIHI